MRGREISFPNYSQKKTFTNSLEIFEAICDIINHTDTNLICLSFILLKRGVLCAR